MILSNYCKKNSLVLIFAPLALMLFFGSLESIHYEHRLIFLTYYWLCAVPAFLFQLFNKDGSGIIRFPFVFSYYFLATYLIVFLRKFNGRGWIMAMIGLGAIQLILAYVNDALYGLCIVFCAW